MAIDEHFPRLRPWGKLVGVSGDLADIVVCILSWLSILHKKDRIQFSDYYSLFDQLSKEFPHLIPELHSSHHSCALGRFSYSKFLGDALENSFQIGVRVSADFQHTEVPTDTAAQNLEHLRKRVGNEFVENLQPVADRLAELMETT